jgi:hypothetical protein
MGGHLHVERPLPTEARSATNSSRATKCQGVAQPRPTAPGGPRRGERARPPSGRRGRQGRRIHHAPWPLQSARAVTLRRRPTASCFLTRQPCRRLRNHSTRYVGDRLDPGSTSGHAPGPSGSWDPPLLVRYLEEADGADTNHAVRKRGLADQDERIERMAVRAVLSITRSPCTGFGPSRRRHTMVPDRLRARQRQRCGIFCSRPPRSLESMLNNR